MVRANPCLRAKSIHENSQPRRAARSGGEHESTRAIYIGRVQYVPNIDRLGKTDSSLEAIDASRAALHTLIERCQTTIAQASRMLEQLDTERKQALNRGAESRHGSP